MAWRQVEQGFSSFFWHIWWFFKVEHAKGTTELWKIIKYGKNLAKKEEERPCATCLQLIFRLNSGTRCNTILHFKSSFQHDVEKHEQSWLVYFFNSFHSWNKRPQINFPHQNFCEKISYFKFRTSRELGKKLQYMKKGVVHF